MAHHLFYIEWRKGKKWRISNENYENKKKYPIQIELQCNHSQWKNAANVSMYSDYSNENTWARSFTCLLW